MKILSIDAETDGLWGNIFSIAGIVYNEKGEEIDKILLRLPNKVVKNEWVKENVLPELDKVTHSEYEKMMVDFANFYMKYKDEATVLWHMGHIVESHLFRELHRLELIGDWDAPYTPIEVSETLRIAGEKVDSVDDYAEKYSLEISDYGSTHNPLYDCEVAFKVWRHLEENRK